MTTEIRTVGAERTPERISRDLRCFAGPGTSLYNCYAHIAERVEFIPKDIFGITLVANFRNKPQAEGIVPVRATGSKTQSGVRFLDIRLPHSDDITIRQHLFSPGDRYILVPDSSRDNESLPVLSWLLWKIPPPPRTSLPLNNPEEDAKKAQENKGRDARAARRDRSAQQLLGALNNPEGANALALSDLLGAADERSIASALAAGLPAPAQGIAGDHMKEDVVPQGSYGMSGLYSQAPNMGLGSVTSHPSNLPPPDVDLAQDFVMEDHVEEGMGIEGPNSLPGLVTGPSQVNVGASGSGFVRRTISAEWLKNALEGFRYLAEDVTKVPIMEEENKKLRLENEQLQRDAAKACKQAGENEDLVRDLMKLVDQKDATIVAMKERMAALSAQLRTQASQTNAAAEHLHAQAAQINAAAGHLYTQAADSQRRSGRC